MENEIIINTFASYFKDESPEAVKVDILSCEMVDEGDNYGKYRIETIGNEFELIIYTDGGAFVSICGGEWFNVETGRKAIMLDDMPRLLV